MDRLEGALPLVEVAVRQALEELARRDVDPCRVAGELAVAVVQRLQVALFPEAFGESSHGLSVVPPKGPPRCGGERMAGYARLLRTVGG